MSIGFQCTNNNIFGKYYLKYYFKTIYLNLHFKVHENTLVMDFGMSYPFYNEIAYQLIFSIGFQTAFCFLSHFLSNYCPTCICSTFRTWSGHHQDLIRASPGLDQGITDAYDNLQSVMLKVKDQEFLIPCGDWICHTGPLAEGFQGFHSALAYGEEKHRV